MDKLEAGNLLEKFLDDLKSHSREDLLGLIANPICIEKKRAEAARSIRLNTKPSGTPKPGAICGSWPPSTTAASSAL